jgi:hypothetical protein
MKHKWEKRPDEEIFTGMMGTIAFCTVCSCKRLIGKYKFATPMYVRSGRISREYLECIDMAAEDLKTID